MRSMRRVLRSLSITCALALLALCVALLLSPGLEAAAWEGFRVFLPMVIHPAPVVAYPAYPAPHTGSVSILPNHSQLWVGDTLYILGEVSNTTPHKVGMVKVSVGLYDESGQRVHSAFAFVDLNTVRPGCKASFKIYAFRPPAFARYAFDPLSYEIDHTPEAKVVVVSAEGVPAEVTTYRIAGELRNDSERIVSNVHLAATLYDSQGRVVGHEGAFAAELVLRPGQSTGYEIHCVTEAPRVASFDVQANAVVLP